MILVMINLFLTQLSKIGTQNKIDLKIQPKNTFKL